MHADAKIVLTLYVMGTGPRSARAIVNVRNLCDREIPGAYRLEVVDIAVAPEQARPNQLLAVPTLVLTQASPPRQFVGDMSNDARIVEALQALRAARPTES